MMRQNVSHARQEDAMIQDILPYMFKNAYAPAVPQDDDVLFYFEGTQGGRCLAVRLDEDGLACPLAKDAAEKGAELRYLFSIDSTRHYLALSLPGGCPEGFAMEKTSVLRRCRPKELCFAGMTACHLYEWYAANRFCGRCGASMEHSAGERSLHCPACGSVTYPAIAPAVIVGVTYGDSILMTRYAHREYKGRALIAGYCEIGETAEDTVVREVLEEVGVRVRNIRYFGSQPWGFDGGLLLGFFAEADGDRAITMDTGELDRASWIPRDQIEPSEDLLSLTATMIEAFRSGKAC